MARIKTFFFIVTFIVTFILLVGCDIQPPTATAPQFQTAVVTPTTSQNTMNQAEVDALVAQAAIAQATADSAATTATHQSIRATQQIENATREAQVAASATAAAINGYATGTAVSLSQAGTGTAIAVFAIEAENSQYATRIAIDATATAVRIQAGQEAVIAAAAAAGTSQAIQDARNFQQGIADIRTEQMQTELELERRRFARTNILMTAVFVVIVSALAATFYIVTGRNKPQVVVVDGRPTYWVHTSDGIRPALTPTVTVNEPGTVLALPAQVTAETDSRPASWERFSGWDDLRYFPIGSSQNEPIMIDTEREPHVMIAGKTGTGKTRWLLWPVVAAAIASGAHVLVVNERGADFKPFHGHPNVTIIRGTRPEMPALTAKVLEAAEREIDRRDQVLREYGISTWNRLPRDVDNGAEVVIVIDEFLALARSHLINPNMQKRMMEAAIVLTAEARKFGIRLIITVTSPGRRALGKQGLTIRDQCARVAFELKDKAVSHAFMSDAGAAALPEGHFIANVGKGIQSGVSFRPSDADIDTYLLSKHVKTVHLPETISGFNAIDAMPTNPLRHPRAKEIITTWETQGRQSRRKVERAVFSYDGGEAYQTVKVVLDAYQEYLSGAMEITA